MRKRMIKTIIAGGIICSLIIGNMVVATNATRGSKSAYASTTKSEAAASTGIVESKEEVIYSSLGTDGTVNNNYSVNILNVTASGEVYDYGDFDSVKNLTNTNQLSYKDGKVSVNAEEGRFYYQGNLANKNLPWNITITYKLDGKEIKGSELAGKEGTLEINIKTSKNPLVDTIFYENFMLQVSVTLDSENCKNIVADGGTFANAGSDKLITFTVMPEKDGDITVTSEVSDFEMTGITLSAIPFSMKVDIGDTSQMTDGLTTLSEAIKQLDEGISELNTGAGKLSDGADSLKDGSKEYQAGVGKLADNSSVLVSGSDKILEALRYINTTLSSQTGEIDLTALTVLPKTLKEMSNGLGTISSGTAKLEDGYAKAFDTLNKAIGNIPETTLSEDELNKLVTDNPKSTTIQVLIENYKAAQLIKKTYAKVSEAFVGVKTTLPELATSIDAIKNGIDTLSGELGKSLEGMDITSSLTQLTEGISVLTDNYSAFNSGLVAYTDGVNALADGYNTLNSGISSVSGGMSELSDGISELSKGTDVLYTETSDLPDKMQGTIDEMMAGYDKSDYTPVSFVSDKNEKVTAVQFVITADGIEKNVVEKMVQKEKKADNFFTRFLALFQKKN